MEFTDWIEYEYDGEIEDDADYFYVRQEWERGFRPNLFIIGLNPRWQMYRFLPERINVMYSAAGFWDDAENNWRRGKRFKKSFGIRFLDCGGYLMLLKYGYYPFSVVNYANLIAYLQPHYYATMDFACEPDLIDARKTTLKTIKARIEATVENAIKLAEWESQLPGQMVPVIQGYTIDEYLECLRLHHEAGTTREYMAVGSMCRRQSVEEIGQIIPPLYHQANRYGVFKLHFFGLKLSPALEPFNDYIWSRDSAVALDAYDRSLREERDGRRFPRGQNEKKAVFYSFLSRLSELGLNYTSPHPPTPPLECA